MTSWQDFLQTQLDGGVTVSQSMGRPYVGAYGDLAAEYRALADGPALVDRSYRGLLEVSGADRATWLHNLTTNDVKTLAPGEGCYAFALNVRGRILFDMNICIRGESIWIDVDRRVEDFARSHFEKYVITEDVSIANRGNDFVRFALAGRATAELLADLGAADAKTTSLLGTTQMNWGDIPILLIRNDFCGPFSVELMLPPGKAVELWQELSGPSRSPRAVPVGDDAVQIHRIEAGLPWPFREITDEYVPAETMQLDRAVSFTKGCYLGQEVVERMRSRGQLARRLVGLKLDGDEVPPPDAVLANNDSERVGRITSACLSLACPHVIALGYVRSASATPGTRLQATWAHRSAGAIVTGLPLTTSPAD